MLKKIIICAFIISLGNKQLYSQIITGAAQTDAYIPQLKNKKVGLIVNQTSQVAHTHLADTLLAENINIKTIFAPEHGFRGKAEAGKTISDGKDTKTGLPVISLYGNQKKPGDAQLDTLDIVVFDIQDVGTRFYTYISTLYLAMEACAENNVPLIVLDRPNPNGMYVDGPVLKSRFESFVGMMPIPVVYGMTIGELAKMIKGEQWTEAKNSCDLSIVPLKNYKHSMHYDLPVKPSPNLPNAQAVKLYPSLCLFEGTQISVARGTSFPFQAIGYPDTAFGNFTFTPRSITGMAENPPFEGQKCYGKDFREKSIPHAFTLQYLIDYYNKFKKFEKNYFTGFFNLLAGNSTLKQKIKNGMSEEKIRAGWQTDLKQFKAKRKKYLLYE